jgi:WD40 repeat protein
LKSLSTIKIWDVEKGLIRVLTGHSGPVCSLTVLNNGELASGSWDKTIKIWNAVKGTLVKILTVHTGTWMFVLVFNYLDVLSDQKELLEAKKN